MTMVNPELQLAEEFIRDTGCNIFLTGKAGTGKTTFLRRLKAISPKRMVVAAPTGVAAISAGGVTLHSFFQLPFGPLMPGSEMTRQPYRFSRQKIDIIKCLDLLVIDEISMVRADLLDGVDAVLRRYRRSNLPFGGVQILMIGDLFQLPPVVKDADWRLLGQRYQSPYFFSSTALGQTEMVTIELQHIYRQADSYFIDLLNRVRNNRLDRSAFDALNQRHIPNFVPNGSDSYITLGTHNRIADTVNDSRLGALPHKVHTFEAQIEGDVPQHTYPTAATLKLKQDAQVMFVRNDLTPEKRYFNGKIGTITHISGKHIRIKCPGDSADIEVEPASWENIDYTLDRETMEITEKKIGVFKQYPLRLAWAITIHKSQGLTFDRVIIDAQAAFAHGQVYVALSRCRTFEGLVLSSPLSSSAIKTDPAVLAFSQQSRQHVPRADQLSTAKSAYQQQLLLECFDFGRLRALMRRMLGLITSNHGSVHVSGVDNIHELQKKAEAKICTVGDNFLRQLRGLFSDTSLPAVDSVVLSRIGRASAYFQETIPAVLGNDIAHLQIDTDNKAIRKKVRSAIKLLQAEVAVKLAAVRCAAQGFSPSDYFRAVSAAAINIDKKTAPNQAPLYREVDIAHPEIFDTLKSWRSRKAKEEKVALYQVLHQKTLIQIAVNLPDTLVDLKRIKGIGKRLAERYGQELVALVGAYRKQHKIDVVTLPTPDPADGQPEKQQTPRTDTKQISLDLFEKGMTLTQIAEKRGLVLSTIEGHMAHWVKAGKVAIDALLASDKQRKIEKIVSQMPRKSFGEIKKALGADVSYGDIKLLQAHLNRCEKE